jgi:hypothetical protein
MIADLEQVEVNDSGVNLLMIGPRDGHDRLRIMGAEWESEKQRWSLQSGVWAVVEVSQQTPLCRCVIRHDGRQRSGVLSSLGEFVC